MPKPTPWLKILNVVTTLVMVVATGLVFLYAPRERTMGEVQRIFYFHVPLAWVGFVALFVSLVAGIAYLRTGRRGWDQVELASVEIGLLFAILTVISGSIWARPAWNTWWTWDPRLTTYTILVLIYFAYLMLRQGIEDPDRRARFAAVYSIVGFVSVPITFFSIRIWRTIHPAVVGTGSPTAEGGFDMTPTILTVFLFCNAAIFILYWCLLANRVRLEQLADRVEQLKARHILA